MQKIRKLRGKYENGLINIILKKRKTIRKRNKAGETCSTMLTISTVFKEGVPEEE